MLLPYFVGVVVATSAGTAIAKISLLVDMESVLSGRQSDHADFYENGLRARGLRQSHISYHSSCALQENYCFLCLILKKSKIKRILRIWETSYAVRKSFACRLVFYLCKTASTKVKFKDIKFP